MDIRTTNKYLGKVVQLDTDDLATSWNVIGQGKTRVRKNHTWERGNIRNDYHLQNRVTGELITVHQKRLVILKEDALTLF